MYKCECGHRFDESLGKYGCPNCNGDYPAKIKIKPHKGGRDFRPSLRLTKDEWLLIKQKAAALKMSVSDWMVHKAKNQRKKI